MKDLTNISIRIQKMSGPHANKSQFYDWKVSAKCVSLGSLQHALLLITQGEIGTISSVSVNSGFSHVSYVIKNIACCSISSPRPPTRVSVEIEGTCLRI